MEESDEKVESVKDRRATARRLIATGVGIAVWFATVVLFMSFTNPPKENEVAAYLLLLIAPGIPAIAAGMIVLGVLRYIDSLRSN
jgi:O-antigen/teichoic acid export membrane protein